MTAWQRSNITVRSEKGIGAISFKRLLIAGGTGGLVAMIGGRVAGFGRLGQLVSCYTRRLTLQERATRQIADALVTHLGAAGAGCVLQAQHLCLSIPRDQHASSRVVTSAFVGVFEQRPELRQRLLGAGRICESQGES